MMHPNVKIQAVRTKPSALRMMNDREEAPTYRDTTEQLPDGSKLGIFWSTCKWRCRSAPYDGYPRQLGKHLFLYETRPKEPWSNRGRKAKPLPGSKEAAP